MTAKEGPSVLEALAQLPTMAHPVVSPDQSAIALYYDVTGRNELHVLDADTGERTQWSDGEVPRNARWFIEWLDDDRLLFHRDDDGNEQNDLFAIDQSGTVEPILQMDGQITVGDIEGTTLLVTANRDGQMNAYRHNLADGTTTKLTEYDRAVGGVELTPQGDRFAYATNETDDYDNVDVYVANVDGTEARNLEIGETGAEAYPSDWAPDGERLLVGDNTADRSRIGVYDTTTDTVRWLGDGTAEEQPVAFMPEGTRVLGTRLRDAQTVPIVYELQEETVREFELPDGVASFARSPVLTDDQVLVTHTTPTQRPALLVYDLGTDTFEPLLEAEYGPFDPDDFADATYFTFESDGVPETTQAAIDHDPYDTHEIGALLYDAGTRPSPLIVNPHGGPRSRDTKGFDLYTQVLVSRGFSVLQVNYRGSTGRGRSFVRELHDDWGGAEQGDIATGVEYALDKHAWLDDDRVIVFGGSYGGYSTYWQLVQYPDLYDAGIAWIGLTDLELMYETTMPHYQTELMEKYLGTPAENTKLYEQRSPITHAANLTAPLLMVHGVNDRRVPIEQARQFKTTLEELGYEQGPAGDFEYQELGKEGHASSDQQQKLRLFRLLDEFLDRRIGTDPQPLLSE